MATQPPPTLGTCPSCTATVATRDVSIEFDTPDGTPALYAECSRCGDVVNPK
jgi:hypothetical protein